MKKFRLKVDTPWADKNSIFTKINGSWFVNETFKSLKTFLGGKFLGDPEKYPHLFELVEEKTDVERVVEWLSKEYKDEPGLYRFGKLTDNSHYFFKRLAPELLRLGLNVDKLEGVE